MDFEGPTLILFVTALPTAGTSVSYDPETVGVVVDPAEGWFLLESGGFTYAALDVGPLDSGQTIFFDVTYFVEEVQMEGGQDVLPDLQFGLAFDVIPEPGTAVLLGVGLLGLGAVRRQRT